MLSAILIYSGLEAVTFIAGLSINLKAGFNGVITLGNAGYYLKSTEIKNNSKDSNKGIKKITNFARRMISFIPGVNLIAPLYNLLIVSKSPEKIIKSITKVSDESNIIKMSETDLNFFKNCDREKKFEYLNHLRQRNDVKTSNDMMIENKIEKQNIQPSKEETNQKFDNMFNNSNEEITDVELNLLNAELAILKLKVSELEEDMNKSLYTGKQKVKKK